MARYCDLCGDPLGTRDLLHGGDACERCRSAAPRPQKAGSGMLQFMEELETRNPLRGTGKLNLPGN